MRRFNFALVVFFALCCASLLFADTLELKNGSIIKGKYLGGTETEVSFQVGSSTQKYNVADIAHLTFESSTRAEASSTMPTRPVRLTPEPSSSGVVEQAAIPKPEAVTIPAGTMITIRTIDAIDSEKNRIGDRFTAALEEPIEVDGRTVVNKGADVYGRLSEAKEAGHISGSSQLKLELTEMIVNGQRVPLLTGEYELVGKGRGANTAKKAAGVGAVGAVIGAIAGGAKGAAIGAVAGAGAGTAVNVVTKGEQVKVPSETVLDFTLQQPLTLRSSATASGQ